MSATVCIPVMSGLSSFGPKVMFTLQQCSKDIYLALRYHCAQAATSRPATVFGSGMVASSPQARFCSRWGLTHYCTGTPGRTFPGRPAATAPGYSTNRADRARYKLLVARQMPLQRLRAVHRRADLSARQLIPLTQSPRGPRYGNGSRCRSISGARLGTA